MLYIKARYVVPLGNGQKAFVKVYDSCLTSRERQLRRLADRERVCLEVLKGLAVPELVEISQEELRRHMGYCPSTYVAQSYVRGRRLNRSGLRPAELLGAWLFLTEQLVAFRRHQILYTDIKSSNVLAAREPLRITQIDFAYAAAASARGVYVSRSFGYTAGFQAPEHGAIPRLTEASLVYQLGMLLGHSWLGLDNSRLRDRQTGLPALQATLRRMGAAGLAELVAECLAATAKDRPRSFEEVLDRIRGDETPRAAMRVWKALRAPYARRLAEVGLLL